MHETKTPVQLDTLGYSPGIKYGYQNTNRSAGQGHISVAKLCKQLPDARLLSLDLRGNVTLTDRGHDFAEWLIKRGHKSEWFETLPGGWGDKPADFGSWFAQPPPTETS